MFSALFNKYISTSTASDIEEVAFATGRSPRPYSRSYVKPASPKRENTILKAVPDVQPTQTVQQPKKEVEKNTMSISEYNRKLDEAIALCKRRK